MTKELVALNQIVHKPKTKVETVMPGERFTPSDTDAEQFLRVGAARELTEGEASGGKKAQKKVAAKPTPSAEKPVNVPSDETTADTDEDDVLS